MIIPVRCYTCGEILSDKWIPYITAVQNDKNKSNIEVNIEKTSTFSVLIDLSISIIFNIFVDFVPNLLYLSFIPFAKLFFLNSLNTKDVFSSSSIIFLDFSLFDFEVNK